MPRITGGQKGTELAFAEITADTTGITSASGTADISPALTVTFTAGWRPFVVMLNLPIAQVTAAATSNVYVADAANVVKTRITRQVTASAFFSGTNAYRYPADPGTSYTLKVRASTTAGTLTLLGSLQAVQLRVTEV